MALALRSSMGLATAMVFACALTGCAGGGTASSALASPQPQPTAARSPLAGPVVAGAALPSGGTAYFGAYVNASGANGGGTASDIASLEAAIGRKLALHMHYDAFTSGFGNAAELDDFNNYRIPIDSWNCGSTDASIVNGAQDSVLKFKADAIRTYGWPVFVRFFWDANLPDTNLSRQSCYDPRSDQQGNFAASQYVLAWQHVHNVFKQEGATNAVFVWSMNAGGSSALQYYPGDAYVDWVGIDNFDLANADFTTTFSAFYNQVSRLNKPIMITETGALASIQPSFFAQAVPAIQSSFPLVRGLVYYDGIYYGNTPGENNDWRVAAGAQKAFASLATNAFFSGAYAR